MSDKNLPESTKPNQLERVTGGYRVRLRYGEGQRGYFTVRVEDEGQAERRAQTLRELATGLVRSGRRSVESEFLLRTLAETTAEKDFRSGVEVVQGRLKAAASQKAQPLTTFAELAEEWTSGRLHERYPDHVKAKRSASDDAARLAVLNKAIGGMPLHLFRLEDAERAMGTLPGSLSSATRRQYAQLISKALRYAVYPCRLIEASPLPAGFLPKVKGTKAKSWLYPAEETALLGNRKIPLGRRMLWGFLAREGLRLGEAMALRWVDLDLERGTVRLDVNKTDDPRMWALGRDVVAALQSYRPREAKPDSLVFPPFETREQEALIFRRDLKASKVERAELYERTAARLPIRVHDLRGTFVTLALAVGRSETWVSDRTGHKSSTMIQRYRRAARSASELGLGWLEPMDQALPETRSEVVPETPTPQGGLQGGPSEAPAPLGEVADALVIQPFLAVPEKGLEPSRGVASADFESAASAIPPLRRGGRALSAG